MNTMPNSPMPDSPMPDSPGSDSLGSRSVGSARPGAATAGRALSVWPSGQQAPRTQRGNRYTPETVAHPGRMLPAVAAYAIAALTDPGDLVLDPMCGSGTSLVEALRLGRPAVGIDVESRWASLARDNIAHTRRAGIGGYAHVITADARALPDVLPREFGEQMLGRVSLVLTSPPYGAVTHGQVRADPGAGVAKSDFRYGPSYRAANLANQPLHRMLAGLTRILTGCVPLLAPGGWVVITTRPWREHGELIDLPGAVEAAATRAGLVPVQRCAALLARLDPDGQKVINRASFFQRTAVARARRDGLPWHHISHEDVIILRRPGFPRGSRELTAPPPEPGWIHPRRPTTHPLAAQRTEDVAA